MATSIFSIINPYCYKRVILSYKYIWSEFIIACIIISLELRPISCAISKVSLTKYSSTKIIRTFPDNYIVSVIKECQHRLPL